MGGVRSWGATMAGAILGRMLDALLRRVWLDDRSVFAARCARTAALAATALATALAAALAAALAFAPRVAALAVAL